MNWEDEGWHTCHFCGEDVNRKSYTSKKERHFLSDCRPDLVEHEIGETCTWYFRLDKELTMQIDKRFFNKEETCYAYQNSDLEWTTEHKHFYPDGPM